MWFSVVARAAIPAYQYTVYIGYCFLRFDRYTNQRVVHQTKYQSRFQEGLHCFLLPKICYFLPQSFPIFVCKMRKTMFIDFFISCDFLAIFMALYGSHSQSNMAFISPISCILAVIFPILINYFPKCEGKGSFLKSQTNSLIRHD